MTAHHLFGILETVSVWSFIVVSIAGSDARAHTLRDWLTTVVLLVALVTGAVGVVGTLLT